MRHLVGYLFVAGAWVALGAVIVGIVRDVKDHGL